MAKSPQREDAAPKELQDRRKSMSWKTFNLKRQLSKVNMKIGGMNTDLESLKNSSIFYTPKEASPDGVMPTPPPPPTEEETTAELREDEALDDAEMAAAASSSSPAGRGKFRSSTTDSPDEGAGSGVRRVDFEQMTATAAVEVERPNNLPLAEGSGPVPLKPARQKFKEKTRDQRLLSVPNIKYQPRDLRGGVRILKNDVSPLTGGGISASGGAGAAGGVSGASASGGGGSKKIRKYGPRRRITSPILNPSPPKNNKNKKESP